MNGRVAPPWRARDVPRVRDRLLRDLADEPARMDALAQASADGGPVGRLDRDLAEGARVSLGHAALYLVADDMADLVVEAAATMPSYELHPSDVTDEDAFVVFSRPVEISMSPSSRRVIAGFSWHRVHFYENEALDGEPVQSGIHVVLWARPADFDDDEVDLAAMPVLFAPLRATMVFGDTFVAMDHPGSQVWSCVPATFLRLVGEPWAGRRTTTHRPAGRRAAVPVTATVPPEVTTFTLRAAPGGPGEPTGEGSEASYSHRWWVRGHWRNQWYPSEDRHAPRWVRGHLKGPDGAPFKPRVGVLRR